MWTISIYVIPMMSRRGHTPRKTYVIRGAPSHSRLKGLATCEGLIGMSTSDSKHPKSVLKRRRIFYIEHRVHHQKVAVACGRSDSPFMCASHQSWHFYTSICIDPKPLANPTCLAVARVRSADLASKTQTIFHQIRQVYLIWLSIFIILLFLNSMWLRTNIKMIHVYKRLDYMLNCFYLF